MINCLSFRGTNRAIGEEAEAPLDMLENLQREENINEDDSRSSVEDKINPTNMLTKHFKENVDQLSKMTKTIASPDRQKLHNWHKLSDELRKFEDLSSSERDKVGMILVKDAELLGFFFFIVEDFEKKSNFS